MTSALWQTNAIALRAGGEAMLIDSPYFPDVLERLVYPEASLGVAESTAMRIRSEPGEAQRKLRKADNEYYVKRERPLSLGSYQPLPVPGKLELGDAELELHPGEGHTDDGMILLARS